MENTLVSPRPLRVVQVDDPFDNVHRVPLSYWMVSCYSVS